MRIQDLLVFAALLWRDVAAADIYVSSSGSDTNDGSASSSPIKSIAAAQKAVRNQLKRSSTENVTVHLAPGVYLLSEPLRLTDQDSAKSASVKWIGPGALLSGGLEVTGWTAGSQGIYSASVPVGTKSRNLYVNGQAANFARRKVSNRKDFTYTSSGIKWTNAALDWISSTAGISGAEIRFINSFTDRYSPIASAKTRELVMKQNAWYNNNWGYDHVAKPNADFGVWVQNALALLSDGGQFFLDSAAGKVYYKPLAGENMATAKTYLGVLETLVAVGGTYDNPAHDITFQGVSFAHTTWNAVSDIGYVDQQTGGYICENKTYTPSNFESVRPWWCQMPSAIQISAAKNVIFSGGNYTQLGAGGIGIGNDPNAHLSGVGLGASYVSIQDGYFSQIMGNSITAGGIRPDAHHPPDNRMINSRIDISNNIFYNVSTLYSSTVPIFVSYVQYSTVSHNDIDTTPYSGICLGYGWGSNDAGGSSEYVNRGLYKYQPQYSTPTISQNNALDGNLIHRYGYGHTDLGALYTLSKSPSTYVSNNYAFDSSGYGTYTDEGSNSYIISGNVLMSSGIWSAVNGANTGNNTYTNNYYRNGASRSGNYQINDLASAAVAARRVAYRAGVVPAKRNGRPVSNPAGVAEGAVTITGGGGKVTVSVDNFDDGSFTGVAFTVTAGGTALAQDAVVSSVPANGAASATFKAAGGGRVSVSATVRYTNSRTGEVKSLSGSGQVSV